MYKNDGLYAIGAFKNFNNEHIEEVSLKFGSKTGVPFLTEATSEGNFEIEVKCKFRKSNRSASLRKHLSQNLQNEFLILSLIFQPSS